MTRFLVLLGGDLQPTPRLRAQISGARVVAADSGIRHADALGVAPELWLGDFDSADPALLGRYAGVPRERFPAAKDRTDGEIAAAYAVKEGAEEIVLAGAFGGRADHAFLHLALALRLAEGGTGAILASGTEEGRPVLPGEAAFDYAPGTLFSVVAFSDLVGLSLDGVRWPLKRIVLPFGSSLTLSNRVETALRVGLEKGRAMLLAQLPAEG